MDPTTIGLIGLIVLVLFLFSRMPVGFVMAMVGLVGFGVIVSPQASLRLLSQDFYATFGSYNLTVVPLFIFMGQLSFHAGISSKLYDTAYKFLGHFPGGLAMATIGACAGFAAICGSTSAGAATMGTVALPEMKRYKYDMQLATGAVAAGGSLGMLIPPSVLLIIYGIMTEQSIGKLFAAGILPGILLSFLFILAILVCVRINPQLGPPGPKTPMKEKLRSLTGVIEMLVIFFMVMGGMFVGFFTPTEAGAAGAFITLLIAIFRRQITWKKFLLAGKDSVETSCMVLVIIAGATLLGHFLAVTRLPFYLADWVSGLPLPAWAIMGVIILIYLFGGCFMDALGSVLLTIPIFFPIITKLGFDPIWFGITIVLIGEMGVITPPVGINVYVVKGIAPDVPLENIFKGIFPFLIAMIVCNVVLIIFPQIALFLPGLMD